MITFLLLAALGMRPHYQVIPNVRNAPAVCIVTTGARGDLYANDCERISP